MSTHKHFDKICCVVVCLAIVLTIVFINSEKLGVTAAFRALGYENKLFSTDQVHTINIEIEDWDGFLKSATQEVYTVCSVSIDGERFQNVALRAKGNTSLSQVAQYGNNRYSFKMEFDHYDDSLTYHGLDKLSLNNLIQDNTFLKDYLTYRMMAENGVTAPLCSFTYITVNGEDWGLYLAVESVEDSFLPRNYGQNYGELYKPDSMSMGGGRGNGKGFDMEKFQEEFSKGQQTEQSESNGNENSSASSQPQNGEQSESPSFPGGGEMPDLSNFPSGEMPDFPGGEMPDLPNSGESESENDGENQTGSSRSKRPGGFMMGANDVALVYSDDKVDSYANIFGNAKTNVSNQDKKRLIKSIKQLNNNENLDEVLDQEEVIRYFVIHNFVLNFDSYTGSMMHNYYLYEKDGKMSMIPWDYNLAFGGFQGSKDATALVNYPIDSPVSGGTIDSRPMLAWIFSSETYTELYHQYFREFITNVFDSGDFEKEIDRVKALIAPYVQKDPTKFCTYEEFETAIDTLKQTCLLRAQSVSGQFDGSIPSTSEGQSADSTAFVQAGDLSVSAMGSMGNMGNKGGGMGGFSGFGGKRSKSSDQTQESKEEDSTKAESSSPDSSQPSGSTSEKPSESASEKPSGSPPEMPSGGFPGMPNGENMTPPPQGGEQPAQSL